MWFHFFTGNHGQTGRASLFDVMEWLTASLIELKHQVTVGDTIAPNAMNVIWENFDGTDEQIFKDHSFKFGLLATEIPVGRTYNWLSEEPWPTRRQSFDKIAPRAEFIWSMVEEPVEAYAQWAPSGYLELGFLESMVDPVFASEPELDFGFYGLNITPYRNAVIEGLKKKFTVAAPDRFLVGRDLNKFISSFRVGICLKHSAQWTIPSPGRVGRLLHAKRGIAAEYVPVQTRASTIVPTAKADEDFAEFCLDCIRGPWKQRAEDAYERYRATMPMKQIMERLLDETVAKVPTPSRLSTLATSDDGFREWITFSHAKREPVSQSKPQLLSAERGYNFVVYEGRVYALDQKIGPVDIALGSATLVQRFGPRAVIVANTLDEARDQVAVLSRR